MNAVRQSAVAFCFLNRSVTAARPIRVTQFQENRPFAAREVNSQFIRWEWIFGSSIR
jgi:hypothetical protein